MQLKYSFKKEWAHFWRTGRFWGVFGGIIAFALFNPLLFRFTGFVMKQASDPTNLGQTTTASVSGIQGGVEGIGGINFGNMADMYSDGGMMFTTSLVGLASYSLLVIMLALMSASGGEQKKRAMIVPMCAGLKYENYLLPKFAIYPLAVLIETFLCGLLTGAMCTSLFANNVPTAGNILLSSALMAVYMAFVTAIYISLGLCTSRPGLMVPVTFFGQLMLQGLLENIGLTGYQPFALATIISRINTDNEFDPSAEMASVIVSAALAVVISALMYVLALGVLKAKKVENQAEVKPEF